MPEPTPPQLTPDDARALLHRAAATIDVGLAGPLDVSGVRGRRRRWPVFAAAAAVLLVAGGLSVVGRPETRPESAPTASIEPDPGPGFQLGPDQVPSVLGQTETSALALLRARGLQVEVTREADCRAPAGDALTTHPGIGTVVAPGDPVELVVSDGTAPPLGTCVVDAEHSGVAQDLLRAAVGAGPVPPHAAGLDLTPALTWLREQASAPAVFQGYPDFRVEQRLLSVTTWTHDPCATVDERRGQPTPHENWLGIGFAGPVGGLIVSSCDGLTVRVGPRGVEEFSIAPDPAGAGGPPQVLGSTPTWAVQRLTAAGYEVRLVPRADCAGAGLVTGQSHLPGSEQTPERTVRVAWTAETGPCLAERDLVDDRQGVPVPLFDSEAPAAAFLRFARSHRPPPFAAQVTVYVDGVRRGTLTEHEAADRAAWGEPLRTLARDGGDLGSDCLPRSGPLGLPVPPGTDVAGMAVLVRRDSCTSLAELVIDTSGAIASVQFTTS